MPTQKETAIQRSFGGGELAPVLHARADLARYQQGLRTCRNFIIQRAGGVTRRRGTRFVGECKTTSQIVQLIPYHSELSTASLLLEVGLNYIRFYQNGAQVNVGGVSAWSAVTQYVNGDLVVEGGINYYAKIASLNQTPPNATFWHPLDGTIFEVPTPFGFGLPYWSQNGRTITLTYEETTPQELTFIDLTRWTMKPVVTAPSLPAPDNPVLTPGGTGARRFAYQITAAAAETYEESEPSAKVLNTGCAEPTADSPHLIEWDAVPGAVEYYIYCDPYGNETFGFIGTATGALEFKDIGFVPDFGVTPPIPRVLFNTSNNFPKVSATYQQRRLFGYTNNQPDAVFGSRVGFPSNFGISSPLQDDDAITFRIAGDHHHPIRHLIGLKHLAILTDAGEWNVLGGQDGVLAPNTINPDQMLYVGSHSTKPVVVGNAIIYLQARGSIMRDVQFDQQVEGLGGRDLTMFSSHLFDGRVIVWMDYQQTPDSIVWACRDDGVMLGLTYIRDEDVWGWHRHDTDGLFRRVCVVPETTSDTLYVIVQRFIDGDNRQYIERLKPPNITDSFDFKVFFVDSGLTYQGAPANNVTGLEHLRGKIAAVVGNGEVVFDGDPAAANAADFTITAGGTFPVPFAASYTTIHVGLPIRFAEIETLELDVNGLTVRDKQKRAGPLSVLIDKSSRSFLAGPDATHLKKYQPPPFEPVADEFTGQVEISVTSTFTKYGRILIRQKDPLPLTVLGVLPYVELGG